MNRKKTLFIDGLAHGEEQALVNKAIHTLNATTGTVQRSLRLVQDVAKMQQLGLVLNGLNLCATCAGFAVMYAKLDSMSTEINQQFLQLQNMMKQGHDLQASYEFDKVLSEHTNMMDCRKTKKPYSEEKMRELVDAEYNVLKLMTGVAEKGLAADHQNMILSIFSMLSMFTVSLCYFDEQYYFNNRSALGDKDVWHSSHQNWMSVYDKLSSPWFIEMLQDYAMFETKLNTLGVDVYYLSLVEQIRDLREKVEDNQELSGADRLLLDRVSCHRRIAGGGDLAVCQATNSAIPWMCWACSVCNDTSNSIGHKMF